MEKFNSPGRLTTSPRIQHDANVSIVYVESIDFSCQLNMTNYPYDTQICSLIFSIWDRDAYRMDITDLLASKMHGEEFFIENSELELISIKVISTISYIKSYLNDTLKRR